MNEITEENLKIHVKSYLRAVKIIDFITLFSKVKIRMHDEGNLIEKGDIFAFNHFSRFETFVPQYLFFKKSKLFCRSIASADFFNESLVSQFLLKLGAVPHSYSDILNFLPREINRGIKLVVFPEGGMIKDKSVVDKNGFHRIYAREKGAKRKPHTGAAVIALHAETCRYLYRMALKNKDKDKVEFYSKYFPPGDQPGKPQIIDRPTQIVPATITFYPLRISENFLYFLANHLGKRSKRLVEEMAIEGNFITKNTDMDIYLGTPINVLRSFTFMDKIILRAFYYLKMGPGPDTCQGNNYLRKLFKKLYEKRLRLLARRLTHKCMKEIYSRVSVNLSHLASLLIFYNIMKKNNFYISKNKFYSILYFVIKKIQKEKEIILHPHLNDPEQYGTVAGGKNDFLNQFLLLAQEENLLTITENSISFLPKLLDNFEFDTIRLENTPRVRYNEVQAIKPLKNIIKKVVNDFDKCEKNMIPEFLFDDDLKLYSQDKEKFSGPEYEDINKRETKSLGGEPFFMKASKSKRREIGILLIHGFPASPAEMKPLGEFLHSEGFTVYGVRLKGHGTSPCDLEQTPWGKCIESIEQGYKVLSIKCKKIVVIGFSIGAVIALDLAGQLRKNICCVVSISASIEVEGIDSLSLIVSAQMEKFIRLIPGVKAKYIEWETDSPEINYRSVPLQRLVDIKNYIERVKGNLKEITGPMMIIQAIQDPLVKQHSAEFVYETISSKNKKIYWYDSDKHIIVTPDCLEVYKNILSFIKRITLQTAMQN